MPFVEGESLRAKLDREKQLSLEEALQLTSDVATLWPTRMDKE
jgi:hypothetical protein